MNRDTFSFGLTRRKFLKRAGVVGATALTVAHSPALPANASTGQPALAPDRRRPKRWLFWDLWKLDYWDNLELVQGKPEFQSDATYIDPAQPDSGVCFPVVYFDAARRSWRLFYSARYSPYTLMIADSDDGRTWRPADAGDVLVDGRKLAANHLFTLDGGQAGGVYVDPVAADGYRFKLYGRQHGAALLKRARAETLHRWHEIATAEGDKRYLSEAITMVSRDGLRWERKPEYDWGLPDWHPEPPIFGYYNHHLQKHCMTVRPGWGDRRVCWRETADFKEWSPPQLLFQPDALDDAGPIGFYGLPVLPYGEGFVGLLWVFHNSSSQPVGSFNQFYGTMDAQLAFSYDGVRFVRGKREPFLATSPHPQHGCAQLRPSSMVETEAEIFIYSEASRAPHGLERSMQRSRDETVKAVTLHTLRKDGFCYVRSRGDWARFQSKPLALWTPSITLNAEAQFGEVRFQITDEKSQPVDGFTFDECLPLRGEDALTWPVGWKQADLSAVVGKVIRLEVRFRNASIYGLTAAYHFLDAQDMWMIKDGKSIDTTLFDF